MVMLVEHLRGKHGEIWRSSLYLWCFGVFTYVLIKHSTSQHWCCWGVHKKWPKLRHVFQTLIGWLQDFRGVRILVIQYNPLPESHTTLTRTGEGMFFLRDFLPTIYTEPPGPPKTTHRKSYLWPPSKVIFALPNQDHLRDQHLNHGLQSDLLRDR